MTNREVDVHALPVMLTALRLAELPHALVQPGRAR